MELASTGVCSPLKRYLLKGNFSWYTDLLDRPETSTPLSAKEGDYVLLVDLPSFGYSDRQLGYNHAKTNRAKNLWELLKNVDRKLPKDLVALSWHLGGHSMGGGTLTAMGMQEKAASLILIDGAFLTRLEKAFLLKSLL